MVKDCLLAPRGSSRHPGIVLEAHFQLFRQDKLHPELSMKQESGLWVAQPLLW